MHGTLGHIKLCLSFDDIHLRLLRLWTDRVSCPFEKDSRQQGAKILPWLCNGAVEWLSKLNRCISKELYRPDCLDQLFVYKAPPSFLG